MSIFSSKNFSIKSLVIVTLFISTGCSININNSTSSYISQDEFAFIEYITTQDAEVLSGNYPRGKRIDGPTYRFDEETKQLQIHRRNNLSIDSIKILIGSGKVLTGAAGSGVSTHLTNTRTLPYVDNKLSINKIDRKGISLTFENQNKTIKEGEKWEFATTRVDTIKMDEPSIIKMRTTYSVRFWGILSKSSISGIK